MESVALVLYRFWLTDQVTGKRRLTSYRMSEADALERHGVDAVKDESSREDRYSVSGGASDIFRRSPST